MGRGNAMWWARSDATNPAVHARFCDAGPSCAPTPRERHPSRANYHVPPGRSRRRQSLFRNPQDANRRRPDRERAH
eukprot:7001910-Prymnesium_polylepis.1